MARFWCDLRAVLHAVPRQRRDQIREQYQFAGENKIFALGKQWDNRSISHSASFSLEHASHRDGPGTSSDDRVVPDPLRTGSGVARDFHDESRHRLPFMASSLSACSTTSLSIFLSLSIQRVEFRDLGRLIGFLDSLAISSFNTPVLDSSLPDPWC
jgi:hypothetical protein